MGSASPAPTNNTPHDPLDGDVRICGYVIMRTTIDLPEDLFREAKTRAVQQGTTLKNLMTGFIRSGLKGQLAATSSGPRRRDPPPVAIRRLDDPPEVPARSNRELHALLEEEDVRTCRSVAPQSCDRP
jgi:hypothetical protein